MQVREEETSRLPALLRSVVRFVSTRFALVVTISTAWVAMFSAFIMQPSDALRWISRSDSIEDRFRVLGMSDEIISREMQLENERKISQLLRREKAVLESSISNIELEALSLREENSKLREDRLQLKEELSALPRSLTSSDVESLRALGVAEVKMSGSTPVTIYDGIAAAAAYGEGCRLNIFFVNKEGLISYKEIKLSKGNEYIVGALIDFVIKIKGVGWNSCVFEVRPRE